MTIDLQTLLRQARQAKQEGQQVVGLAVGDVIELAERISKAEAEAAGFKQIIGAEVLRCQPGDVVLVNMDAKWLGGSEEYDYYRSGLMSILPAGVKAIAKVAGIDFSVLTDEQLADAGLAKLADLQAMDTRAMEYFALVESQSLRIAELELQAIPEGWQLVQEEPTTEMLEMAERAAAATGGFPEVWQEMLAAAPKLATQESLCKFRVGQPVKKVTGEYKISGVVRSVFTKGDGGVRLVVEHTVKDEHGEGAFLHIYGPSNLAPLSEGGAA